MHYLLVLSFWSLVALLGLKKTRRERFGKNIEVLVAQEPTILQRTFAKVDLWKTRVLAVMVAYTFLWSVFTFTRWAAHGGARELWWAMTR